MKYLFPAIIAILSIQSCSVNRRGIKGDDREKSDDSIVEDAIERTSDAGDSDIAVSENDDTNPKANDGKPKTDSGFDDREDSGSEDGKKASNKKTEEVSVDDDNTSDQQSPEVIERPPTSSGEAYGDWTYYEVEGAVCRDGSAAGYYRRDGSSKNLLVFLNGGGICYDAFFCSINPKNVNESLPGETLLDATLETIMGSIAPVRQIPPDDGILKKDPENPVLDWSMIFVPYCTGDVYGGTKPDATVITSPSLAPQQFVGYSNIGLFYRSFGPDFLDSEKVLLAGSSAGGFGALLNYDRTQRFFKNSRVVFITDSAVPFRDQYQPTCLQKIWRELWSLDDVLPKDCNACFGADGGGLAELGAYDVAHRKYENLALGGVISSTQDQVVKVFYSAGLNNCTANTATQAIAAFAGAGSYPYFLYPLGVQDYLMNVLGEDNAGSYIIDGITHQHIFRTRFYEENGVGMTLAAWVADVIAGKPTHVGSLP